MRESQPDGRHRIVRALGAAAIATCLCTTALAAQIRGRPAARPPDAGWWFSGGVAAMILNDISDGATRSTWKFGSDPLWQMRGTLEKALDEATTIGISAGYGVVDLALSPMTYTTAKPPSSPAKPPRRLASPPLLRSGRSPGFGTTA